MFLGKVPSNPGAERLSCRDPRQRWLSYPAIVRRAARNSRKLCLPFTRRLIASKLFDTKRLELCAPEQWQIDSPCERLYAVARHPKTTSTRAHMIDLPDPMSLSSLCLI